jgi:hypothetical protein
MLWWYLLTYTLSDLLNRLKAWHVSEQLSSGGDIIPRPFETKAEITATGAMNETEVMTGMRDSHLTLKTLN